MLFDCLLNVVYVFMCCCLLCCFPKSFDWLRLLLLIVFVVVCFVCARVVVIRFCGCVLFVSLPTCFLGGGGSVVYYGLCVCLCVLCFCFSMLLVYVYVCVFCLFVCPF